MILITVICSASLARVDCVADKSKLMNESYIFFYERPSYLYSFLSSEHWRTHFRALKVQNFSEGAYPQTPLEEGD